MSDFERCDVVVIGAGPAGSSMALLLRRAGWRVALLERARFPRDKLCGEFISAEGVAALTVLGLGDWLTHSCPQIDRVQVSSRHGAIWQERLPQRAVGCSRAALDHQLLQQCLGFDVDVREGVRVTAVEDDDLRHGSPNFPVVTTASGAQLECRLVIYASGRQSALLRTPNKDEPAPGAGSGQGGGNDGMLGLKLHAHEVEEIGTAVELHAFDGGYVGPAAVEGRRVNLCALLTSSALRRAGKDPQRLADEVMATNRRLARRLERLQPDWSQALAVANLRFGPAPASGRLCVGDSAGAIAPLCGDGISMALHASQLAAPLVDRYLSGVISGAQMLDSYRRQWQRQFGLRLALGNQLQALLMRDVAGTLALWALQHLPALGRWVISRTRG